MALEANVTSRIWQTVFYGSSLDPPQNDHRVIREPPP